MIKSRIWIEKANRNFIGPGKVELLERINTTGSIQSAAKEMKMSYKAAWDMVDSMNNLSDNPLVKRVPGGKGKGGTMLTEEGKNLVSLYKLLELKNRQFLSLLNDGNDFVINDVKNVLNKFSIKTSARNQILGKVSDIQKLDINCKVKIDLGENDEVIASITHQSLKYLDLKINDDAVVILKSNAINLHTNYENIDKSADNILDGKITTITKDKNNSEVSIKLKSQNTLICIVKNETIDQNDLKFGQKVTTTFNSSSVIIGV